MVLSIEAKKNQESWEVYTDCGRESTGIDTLEWAKEAVSLGAGEVLITSIDREGTRKGYDTELVNKVSSVINVPLISSGGFGKLTDIDAALDSGSDAIAIADAFHYNRLTLSEVRSHMIRNNINTRNHEDA